MPDIFDHCRMGFAEMCLSGAFSQEIRLQDDLPTLAAQWNKAINLTWKANRSFHPVTMDWTSLPARQIKRKWWSSKPSIRSIPNTTRLYQRLLFYSFLLLWLLLFVLLFFFFFFFHLLSFFFFSFFFFFLIKSRKETLKNEWKFLQVSYDRNNDSLSLKYFTIHSLGVVP